MPSPTIVQSNTGSSPTAPSLGSLPTAGSAVVLLIGFNGTGTPGTIGATDNQGNTFSNIVQQTSTVSAGNVTYSGIFQIASIGATSGSYSVSHTPVSGDGYNWALVEVANGLLDKSGANQGIGTNSQTASVTATGANSSSTDLVLAMMQVPAFTWTSAPASPPSTGYTAFGTSYQMGAYKTTTTGETSSANWGTVTKNSGNFNYSAVIATFQYSSGSTLFIAPAAGSYALAGETITLTRTGAHTNYSLTSAFGSYAVAGGAATLLRNRQIFMIANAGAYDLVGGVETRGYGLAVSSGSFSAHGVANFLQPTVQVASVFGRGGRRYFGRRIR